MSSKTIRSICFECHSRCGVILEVSDGKLVSIKGDKDHPFSKGYICPKGRAVSEIVYHPERITRPLIRVGEKGMVTDNRNICPVSASVPTKAMLCRVMKQA